MVLKTFLFKQYSAFNILFLFSYDFFLKTKNVIIYTQNSWNNKNKPIPNVQHICIRFLFWVLIKIIVFCIKNKPQNCYIFTHLKYSRNHRCCI